MPRPSRSIGLAFGLLLACGAWASGGLTFTENRGQWPSQVLFRAHIPGGALFVERGALTFVLAEGGEQHRHGHAEEGPGHRHAPYRAHAYRVTFEGATGGVGEGMQPLGHRENHFIGNDPAQWGADCGVYPEVWVKDLYPGIDLRVDGRNGLKYDLLVSPGVDPDLIRMRYEGQDGLAIEQGRLVVRTSAGMVVEEAPVAFGPSGTIACHYRLKGDRLGFELPDGHDDQGLLVIDPTLTFASYSGSTADNFGFTATYDATGNLYGGGIVFGFGYPVTVGALQPGLSGGTIDVGISKWDATGSTLLWSTYLGGAQNESPHSLVVNDAGELFVLGSTGSSDFPTTAGCFDNSFGGGPSLNFTIGYGYNHSFGVDAFVARLSAAGNALLGSTFVGGAGADGINNDGALAYNYGDSFRGEIALDPNGNPVVATSTETTGLPVTPGAPQPAFGGGQQDGYVFRLNAGLTTLLWATYVGGTGDDSAFGVQFDSNGEVFVTGGTTSTDLPMAGAPYDGSHNGSVDGYIMRYNATGNALLGSTYLGTAAYDQSYFVQLDTDDEVYVVGQTRGNYPVTPGKYANPGSSQFIHKFDHALSTSLWSTRIGNGSGTEDIAPSAFLVSDCGQIYFSGWGGAVNNNGVPNTSTTTGLPTTPGAFQSSTDGSDFHLMVLEPDAIGLNYATFFGGNLSAEHVDGGTSRFDKNGNVYQAVCAGCGGNSDFPTTPGAWSNTNNNPNCNLGVFKFALSQTLAVIAIDGPQYVCHPGQVQFDNLSNGGNTYSWSFGDGATSTDFEPTHTYGAPGTYTVMMVLEDSLVCTPPDTAYVTIEVVDPLDAAVDSVPPVCAGATVQLQASGGTAYLWSPGTGLNSTTVADPVCTPLITTTYQVLVTDQCGTDTAFVVVEVDDPSGFAGPDAVMCAGDAVTISASGGATYSWSPANFVDDATSATPLASPPDTTLFTITIVTADGCVGVDSVLVTVQFTPPDPISADTAVCEGGSVQLHVSGGDSYAWIPTPGLATLTVPDPVVTPPVTTDYVVLVSNTCGTTPDTVTVLVVVPMADAWPDTLVCPNVPVPLFASGGVSYVWSPSQGLDNDTSATPIATVGAPTVFTVISTDAYGCSDTAQVSIDLLPQPVVNAGPDVSIDYGDATTLFAIGDGVFSWSPGLFVEGTNGALLTVRPETTTLYTVQMTDANGCLATDQVLVIIDGALYVPNTFTPNEDGINDTFFALGKEIDTFRMMVFNRWGEMIFETDVLTGRWDGTYNGVGSPIDTYVWRVDYTELNGEDHVLYGHVNLVR
ncbi:MAG TPA: gliding motility-associated C-terminal domain-containing protein [Flavobacteriales bacterium]|nr:gliding motility-associated C-terminal domain-containing protein [Flavobacteriales bacterium]HQW85734.1 gliding motility-associated C-terminal domain-containing protein [Flavobacteriales bacterium]